MGGGAAEMAEAGGILVWGAEQKDSPPVRPLKRFAAPLCCGDAQFAPRPVPSSPALVCAEPFSSSRVRRPVLLISVFAAQLSVRIGDFAAMETSFVFVLSGLRSGASKLIYLAFPRVVIKFRCYVWRFPTGSLGAMNRPRWTSTACKSKRTTSSRAYARLSQGDVAADLVLCMHAKGEGRFAEHVLQKLEEKERHSLLLAQKEEEREQKKRSVPSSTEEEDMKPSPTKEDKKNKEKEAPKEKKAKKARLSTYAQVSSVVKSIYVLLPQGHIGAK